jgi:hypothetical protein
MAHFAKVENGIVTSVIVADQETINSGIFGEPSLFIQTSYNTFGGVHYGSDGKPDGGLALRYNYAGIGFIYDSVKDAFYAPQSQTYPSWVFNETTCQWDAPIPYPDDGKKYHWDESIQQWVTINV